MRAADADILILPGLGGGSLDHWYSRWQKKLSTARRVEQANWDAPSRAEWVETLVREIAACERPVICVAHSLGVITMIHAAPLVADKLAGAFLVAPPSESALRELPGVNADFLPLPRRALPFPTIMVGSSDDPYADLLFPRDLARDLGAVFVDAGAAGHINAESGHGPWPEGSIAFQNFVSRL